MWRERLIARCPARRQEAGLKSVSWTVGERGYFKAFGQGWDREVHDVVVGDCLEGGESLVLHFRSGLQHLAPLCGI